MKYKNKTRYKAIQWTGENEKEIAKFLGERFVLKKDPPDKYGTDIFTKETDDFVDSLCFTNSWIIMPEGGNAKPEVILEENFKEKFVSVDKPMGLKEAKALWKKAFIKEIWFIHAFSKGTYNEPMFWILPDEESTDKKIIELEEKFNPHPEHPYWNWEFVKQKGIKFGEDLSVQ